MEATVRPAGMGDLAWAMHAQAETYRDAFGYGPMFETYLLQGAARFAEAFDPERDRLLIADGAAGRIGCIAVQHAPQQPGWAQLRWYLVVDGHRGTGVGRRLMEEAVAFQRDAGYEGMFLWTVDDLVAAARVYAAAGFRLVHEEATPCAWAPWGREQRWELRSVPGPGSGDRSPS